MGANDKVLNLCMYATGKSANQGGFGQKTPSKKEAEKIGGTPARENDPGTSAGKESESDTKTPWRVDPNDPDIGWNPAPQCNTALQSAQLHSTFSGIRDLAKRRGLAAKVANLGGKAGFSGKNAGTGSESGGGRNLRSATQASPDRGFSGTKVPSAPGVVRVFRAGCDLQVGTVQEHRTFQSYAKATLRDENIPLNHGHQLGPSGTHIFEEAHSGYRFLHVAGTERIGVLNTGQAEGWAPGPGERVFSRILDPAAVGGPLAAYAREYEEYEWIEAEWIWDSEVGAETNGSLAFWYNPNDYEKTQETGESLLEYVSNQAEVLITQVWQSGSLHFKPWSAVSALSTAQSGDVGLTSGGLMSAATGTGLAAATQYGSFRLRYKVLLKTRSFDIQTMSVPTGAFELRLDAYSTKIMEPICFRYPDGNPRWASDTVPETGGLYALRVIDILYTEESAPLTYTYSDLNGDARQFVKGAEFYGATTLTNLADEIMPAIILFPSPGDARDGGGGDYTSSVPDGTPAKNQLCFRVEDTISVRITVLWNYIPVQATPAG